jgi:hypothetical protein
MSLETKKHKFVSDLTKENDLGFIAILESGRSDFILRFSQKPVGGGGRLPMA